MQVAFLVKLELNDRSDVDGIAQSILEELEDMGLPVTEVKPWSAQTLQTFEPPVTELKPNVPRKESPNPNTPRM